MFFDWLIEALTPKPPLGRARDYGNLAFLLSCLIAMAVVFQQGDPMAFALPVITAGMLAYRVTLMIALHAILTLIVLDSVSFFWNPATMDSNFVFDGWIVIPILLQLIFSLRCLAMSAPEFDKRGQKGVVRRSEKSFSHYEISQAVVIAIAVAFVAGFLTSYIEPWTIYAPVYALKPEGLRMVLLIAVLFVLFFMVASFLAYMKTRTMDQFEATTVLQNVIWRWNGKEQELIGKLTTKKRKRDARLEALKSSKYEISELNSNEEK